MNASFLPLVLKREECYTFMHLLTGLLLPACMILSPGSSFLPTSYNGFVALTIYSALE